MNACPYRVPKLLASCALNDGFPARSELNPPPLAAAITACCFETGEPDAEDEAISSSDILGEADADAADAGRSCTSTNGLTSTLGPPAPQSTVLLYLVK